MKVSEDKFRELLDRYLTNTASAQEREILDKFFNSYRSEISGDEKLPDNLRLMEEIMGAIQARTAARSKQSARAIRWLIPVAAAISLFVLAFFLIDQEMLSPAEDVAEEVINEKTRPGQKLLTTLPDGTRVHLNGDSELSYPAAFGAYFREVSLTGEGYFEVVRDAKPFLVRTRQVTTEVLGTSFNVKNTAGDHVAVTLIEGRVKVRTPSGISLLNPNEQAVIAGASGQITTREVDVLRYVSWKDNVLFFHETSMKEAIRTLESWYGVKLALANPALEKCSITAKYQNEPLGNVLSSFQFLFNLHITRLSDRHYSIDGPGCK